MRTKYDFTKLKEIPNPYASKLKKQITIRIDVATIDYFKRQAKETSVPYQQLINLYLSDCAANRKALYIN